MVMWKVILTKQANKDAKKLTAAGLKSQTETLVLVPSSETQKGIFEAS